jgi:hypothetical protein
MSENRLRRAILTVLVVPLAALVACNELPTERIEPDDPLGHHRPGHAGGGTGGGDDGSDDGYVAQVIDAGNAFPGTSFSYGIDEQGTVVGVAYDNADQRLAQGHAFLWRPGDADLQPVPGLDPPSVAHAIRGGVIAGTSQSSGFVFDGLTTQFLDHLPATSTYEVELDDGGTEERTCEHDASAATTIASWGAAGTSFCDGVSETARGVVWLATRGYEPFELKLRDGDLRLRDVLQANANEEILGRVVRANSTIALVIWLVQADGSWEIDRELPVETSDLWVNASNSDGDMAGINHPLGRVVTADGSLVDLYPVRNRDDWAHAYGLGDRDAQGQVRAVGRSGDRPALWTVDAAAGQVLSAEHLELPGSEFAAGDAGAINAAGAIAGSARTKARGNRPITSHATVWLPASGN